jgi:predicted MPP superfamily phosphohydrolase/GTPase SAR1 family protein
MIRIAHLSDFHTSDEALFESDHLIVDPLIEDLQSFHETQPIDLVVCSGDLIHHGGQEFGSTKKAFEAFSERVASRLLDALSLNRSRFILAPGNHDVDYSRDSPITEKGIADKLSSQDEIKEYIESGDQEGSERIDPYHEFTVDFYDGAEEPSSQTRYESVFVYEEDGTRIGVAALNSAWRCVPSKNEGQLLLGRHQILRALEHLDECDVKIAVSHYSPSHLSKPDKDSVEPLVRREFDLLFCGHVHRGHVESTQVANSALFVSTSPGALHRNIESDSREYANGYRIVDFNPHTLEISAHSRRYAPDKNVFDPNTDLGNDQGVTEYQLPSSEERRRYDEARDLAERIIAQHVPALNQQLLSSGTDTEAPESIMDVFVMPEVVHRKRVSKGRESDIENEVEDIDETNFNLKDLASTEENLVLLGEKETGKTVLLNRLLIELAEGIDEYRQIPVRINFQELGNRRIESEVNQFLGVGSREVDRVASEHNLTLLVDDITFQEHDNRRIERLRNFAEEHPGTRIVATYCQSHSGELPMGSVRSLQLRPLEVKLFRTEQLRALVNRWFSKCDAVDTPSQIQNIVSLFEVLDIPRTPLAASMMLWIIEKQEGYKPKNKATMVENFIERLLQKHAREEALSGQFDFTNKVFLLSGLAHQMLKHSEPNYRIRYSEALEHCEKHLRGREWQDEFPARQILENLIEAGIFVENGNHIRFRFRCFFEYFLAKRMEHDREFREFVLSEERYLAFPSEIEYYTGIKRSCTSILREFSIRLEDLYSDIHDHLLDGDKTCDDYLEDGPSRVSAMDANQALARIAEDRPSEEDLEALQDERLELAEREQGIAHREQPEDILEKLSRALFLTAQVLKYTEETDEPEVKTKVYQNVIQCALIYTVLYTIALRQYLEEFGDELSVGFREFSDLLADYAPVTVQVELHNQMGTKKLNGVFRSEAERTFQNDEHVSDLEQFFSVFLLAENRGNGYLDWIENLIDDLDTRYMEDIVFLKLLIYFYVRSKSEEMDNRLLNLMAEVLVKAKDLSPSKKGRIMEDYRRKKLRRDAGSQEDKAQMPLDM